MVGMDPGSPRAPASTRRRGRDPLDAEARRRLGFDRLTDDQRAAIETVLEGRDTLAVLPTGSGKSAVYQLAGSLIPGPTVVISPLIALQEDQLAGLRAANAGRAATLNSAMGSRRRRETLDALDRGELEFLLLAPEQLDTDSVLDRLRAIAPSLFVVDEAHCIADWGHDFRPEYLRLGAVAKALGDPVILALTATASPQVRAEIVERLAMDDAAIIVRDPDRPGLDLAVEHPADERSRVARVRELVGETDGAAIVYSATRAGVERVAAVLRDAGEPAAAYHAGQPARERTGTLDAFMAGELRVVVATSAFGMGVDKPDVRLVVHAHAPPSIDAYWQEVGRGGRDGEPARAVLLFRPEDLGLRRFFAVGAAPEVEQVEQVLHAVGDAGRHGSTRAEVGRVTTLPAGLVERITASLLGLGVLRATGAGRRLVRGPIAMDAGDAAVAVVQAETRRIAAERSRVEQVGAYATTVGCRRAFLLSAFGHTYEPPCGACDRCRSGVAVTPDDDPELAAAMERFPLGTKVDHATWGRGVVERLEPGAITVRFQSVGHRRLATDLVTDGDLLRPEARG